jgi:NADH-quinone oxidoreductase subunit M
MGFVVLGIAAVAWARGTTSAADGMIAMNGAVLQMFNHGLSAAGMFFLVGVLYERTHTRELNDFGGLWPLAPIYGGILIFTSMGSLGLPGLGGFVSEFLVVRGSWPIFTLFTAIAMLGLLLTGAYVLKAIQKVLPSAPLERNQAGDRAARSDCHCAAHGPDAGHRRMAVLAAQRHQRRGDAALRLAAPWWRA